MNTLAEYLHVKHLEYCNEKRRMVTESGWVLDELNSNLPPGDKLSNGSVNQWMNGGRQPDGKNIIRLIKVFGPEVMPYVGIYMDADLARLFRDWDKLDKGTRQKILEIAHIDKDPGIEIMKTQ